MRFDASMALWILRLVLCNETILGWLEAEAKKTDTPIDDTAIRIIKSILCAKTESENNDTT